MADTPQNEQLDTQIQDTPGGGEQQGGNENQDQWFLEVDDRTRYRTADDAKKAYKESGQRIANLSQWEREAKKYGLTDPTVLPRVFDHYLQLRQQSEQSQNRQQPTPQPKQQTDEQKQAREWLLKEAKELGFISKEEYEEMQNEVASLKQSTTQNQQQIVNQRVEQGSTFVTSLLKDASLPVDPKFQMMVETNLRYWIEAEPARLQAFMEGGEAQRTMMKEGFEEVKGALGLLQKQNSTYAQDKNTSQQRNRTLPEPGTGANGQQSNGQSQPVKKGLTPAIHDKAWDIFSKLNKK